MHLTLISIAPKYAGGRRLVVRTDGWLAVYEVGAVRLQEVGHSITNMYILFHLLL